MWVMDIRSLAVGSQPNSSALHVPKPRRLAHFTIADSRRFGCFLCLAIGAEMAKKYTYGTYDEAST